LARGTKWNVHHKRAVISVSKQESAHARDKTKVGEPDRRRVSGDQDYEIRYIAKKYSLTIDQVKKLIARVGNDREKIEAAARQL
jgi:hypothetical protein